MVLPSMVIHDLDVLRAVCGPNEANPPLVVDPDAVLSFSISLQCFQFIARRSPQVFEYS